MKLQIHIDTFESGDVQERTPYQIQLTPEQIKFIQDKLTDEFSIITGVFLLDDDGELIQ